MCSVPIRTRGFLEESDRENAENHTMQMSDIQRREQQQRERAMERRKQGADDDRKKDDQS